MNPISDIQSYNKNMSRDIVMNDKLFFLEEADPEIFKDASLIVDFGCADGSLIAELTKRLESITDFTPKRCVTIIGYDTSEEMISFAQEKFSEITDSDVKFTSNWDVIKNDKHFSPYYSGNKILILSSVLHEIYSYDNLEELNLDFKRIFESGFDYIFIRDMMVPDYYKDIVPSLPTILPSFIEKQSNITVREYIKKALSIYSSKHVPYLESFEEKWGPIDKSVTNFLHFALKYRWIINWDREVNENYLGLSIEDFLDKDYHNNYEIVYYKRFCPIKINFERITTYPLKWNTHIKMILKLKSK